LPKSCSKQLQSERKKQIMDSGTARDFIQDLQEENARLHQAIATLCAEMTVLESERDELQRKIDRFGV
jgi:predicted  nucleic acid-binding Zn-ribbon protein